MIAAMRRALNGVFLVAAGLACGTNNASSQDSPDAVELSIRWDETKPYDSLHNPLIILLFHNGQIDSFNLGQQLPDLMANWLPINFTSSTDPFPIGTFSQEISASFPGAIAHYIRNPPPDAGGEIIGNPPRVRLITLDPGKHRFMSYVVKLFPSNDAFVANEDPFEIEVFDSEGKFKGPLYVDIFGNQVLDAGLCENDEAVLSGLNVSTYQEQTCNPENGVVTPHPGLNGSWRNPDGVPQHILGGTASFYPPDYAGVIRHFGIESADFSRPGYKIGRFKVMRRLGSGEISGSYYSPDRAGEGFNIEIVEPAPGQAHRRILVYWYTFKPDGSGEQVWLAGMGEIGADGGVASDVEMYVTTGGEFASTSNPNLVDRQRWGTIRIGFGQCGHGRVFYYPDDPDWPTGDYFINRLSPSIEGLGWTCAPPENSRLILPED